MTKLIPQNYISLFICTFIIILFIYWLVKAIRIYLMILANHKCNLKFLSLQNLEKIKENILSQNSLSFIRKLFNNNCEKLGEFYFNFFSFQVRKNRFDTESYLTILEEHFENKLDRLKTIFSIFIILGLLGTLFGLADSFVSLEPIFNHQKSSVTDASEKLMSGLSSAFSPSILGVVSSILSFWIYSYISKVYISFWSKFKSSFYSIIIDSFYTPTNYKWIDLLAETSYKLVKASKSIQESATNLNSNLTNVFHDFGEDVESLRNTIKELNTSVDKSKNSYEILIKNIDDLNNFTKSMITYTEKMPEFMGSFDRFSEEWNNQIKGVAKIITEYENINKTLDNQIVEFKEIVLENNSNLAKEFTNSFDSLSKVFDNLNQELPRKLQTIKDELSLMKTPIEASSERIETTFSNFVKYVKDYNETFSKYVKNIHGEFELIKQPFENTSAGIEHILKNINEYFEDSSKKQKELLNIIEQIKYTLSSLSKISPSKEIIINRSKKNREVGEDKIYVNSNNGKNKLSFFLRLFKRK